MWVKWHSVKDNHDSSHNAAYEAQSESVMGMHPQDSVIHEGHDCNGLSKHIKVGRATLVSCHDVVEAHCFQDEHGPVTARIHADDVGKCCRSNGGICMDKSQRLNILLRCCQTFAWHFTLKALWQWANGPMCTAFHVA